MAAPWLIVVLGLGWGAIETPIDAFQYTSVEAARAAWQAGSGTPPVQLGQADGKTVMVLPVPFGADRQLERTILDRRVQFDLAAAGGFVLRLSVEAAELPGRLSLYFRSGDGWYAAACGLKTGPQTVRFSKASFNTEGDPAGWQQIDGIRLSVWRTADVDGQVRFERLVAVEHEVALVVPDASSGSDGEVQTAGQVAERVAAMLDELGLGSDAIEESSLVNGSLGKRKVAVLAYNPRISREALDALEAFITGGGKVFACYTLPSRLGNVLGFEPGEYVRPAPGTLAEIRFDAPDVAGLPQSAGQASWNITTAKPAGHGAAVIGRWFDDQGRPTGYPALLLSDRGAFLTHILLSDDPDTKKQMLAAVLGKLEPDLWREMAASALRRCGRVGPFTSWPAASQWLDAAAAGGNGDQATEIDRHHDAALANRQAAASAVENAEFPAAVRYAAAAEQNLAKAYLAAQPSPAVEGRAWWNHSGTGAYPGDWDRTATELHEKGCNMVIPNLLWAGRAHYASDVLPRSSTFRQYGDQIAQCVAACQRHGVEVHVWKVNFNLSGAPAEFVEQLRRAGRTQVSVTGEPIDWLNPAHPENFQLELESMLEVARKYDVDGLHFDYIRYPHGSADYSEFSRRQFQEDTGQEVVQWPDDCYRGKLKDEYRAWRCRQINRLVEAVSREARRIKPQLKISAAVFGAYPDCRESVGQDWPHWIESGWLDFVCPMDYTPSDERFEQLVDSQRKLVGGRIPMYPGIGATASRTTLAADRVVAQIGISRRLGAQGFTIFDLSRNTAETILPGLALSATATPATPPHRQAGGREQGPEE